MGNLPHLDKPVRVPLAIETPPHTADHHFQGRAVLPAVDAMEALARGAKAFDPNNNTFALGDARFDKFLFLDPETDHIDAFGDLERLESGDLRATLITRTRSPHSTITRTKAHARVVFPKSRTAVEPLPLDLAAVPAGVCSTISPDTIYRELVPFGPAYRNIRAPVRLSTDGAVAEIRSPVDPKNEIPLLLGTGFPLDAAFHAACVWGQQFAGVVAFPVAIGQREVHRPTCGGNTYFSRIIPVQITPERLVFDIWLMDGAGVLHETALGVEMRDVSGGRLKPPSWMIREAVQDAFEPLKQACLDGTVIELDAMAPLAEKALSPVEKQRFARMAGRRRTSYLAARVALKRLWRILNNDWQTAPETLTTICSDLTRPCFPSGEGLPRLHCSVAHDRRFAVAVAAEVPVGVDVEMITDRAFKNRHVFMSETERCLVRRCPMEGAEAAVRVWSAKEAVTKAAGMNLAEAWDRVRITDIGHSESRLRIDGGRPCSAVHVEAADHLFTLFTRRPASL